MPLSNGNSSKLYGGQLTACLTVANTSFSFLPIMDRAVKELNVKVEEASVEIGGGKGSALSRSTSFSSEISDYPK
jgi:hypothetical protein